MSINATSTSVSSASSTTSTSNSVKSSDTKDTSTDSSFKKELEKASSDKKAEETKQTEKSEKTSQKDTEKKQVTTEQEKTEAEISLEQSQLQKNLEIGLKANNLLSDDISKMATLSTNNMYAMDNSNKMNTLDYQNSIKMTEGDADFFLNLTQNNDISAVNINAQAQNAIQNGAEVNETEQHAQVSQTLLNAIAQAKETNQPLRIDFDKNVSVILQINKDGNLSANFIPGDKAVEQYLKDNISALRQTFDDNNLPYSELSYSNRGKREQQNRRNNQRENG